VRVFSLGFSGVMEQKMSFSEVEPNSLSPRPAINLRWFVAQCQPHREGGAAIHLKRQSYEVFLPLREKVRRHARRIETVFRPFFPGYLFVHLDLESDQWRPINSTFGIARVVMSGERPALVPCGVVEALRACCNENDILEWQPSLVLGEAVRVSGGPFADLVGTLDRLDGPARVRVLLNLLGGEIPVWLPRSSVIPAASLL